MYPNDLRFLSISGAYCKHLLDKIDTCAIYKNMGADNTSYNRAFSEQRSVEFHYNISANFRGWKK